VAVNAWRGRGYLRISAQVNNTKADVDRLAEACDAVLRRS
jgi:selenocysteine lyase/cysteine desulfurase